MGRGINLGNTLEPPTEGAWNNGPARESYFDLYREAGFTNVRIPVRWDRHTSSSVPYTVTESWMDRVEEVVDWALERDFYVTLNGHHEDWLKNNYANPTARARYDSIWVQILDRFQDKSDKLIFEIINEPVGMSVAQVDDLNFRILAMIRAVNPTRIVIYGGNVYSNAEQLYTAAIPPNDDYIIGYFHNYDPWDFAGRAVRGWGSAQDYSAQANKLRTAATWSANNNVPVTVSEFGAVSTVDEGGTTNRNDFNDRMRYYASYVDQLTRNNLSWSVWDDGGWFGVLDRNQGRWPELKDVLIHYYPDSPHRMVAENIQPTNDDPRIGARYRWELRTTDNDSIYVERRIGLGTFRQVAVLAPDATEYADYDVDLGRTYAYRIYTHRADGTLLHGYPQQTTVISRIQAPYFGRPLTIPGTIDAEVYDFGGEGLAYHDTEAQNIPGGFRPEEGVDLEPNGKGGFHVGYVAQDEWVEYTVIVAEAGNFVLDASVASQESGGSMEISVDGETVATFNNIAATGGWTAHTTLRAPEVFPLTLGTHVVRMTITGTAPFNIDNLTFSLQTNSAHEAVAGAPSSATPNPVVDELRLELPGTAVTAGGEISVMNMAGAVVGRQRVTGRVETVSLGDLPAGTYVVRYLAGGEATVWRVVKR